MSKSIGAALEIDLVRELASGNPVAGVTWYAVNQMNAKHAQEHHPDKPEPKSKDSTDKYAKQGEIK